MADSNTIIGGVSTFAALMAGISIAVERVVQIIKGAVPPLTNPWAKNDGIRAGILQLLAALTGAVIASQMPEQIRSAIPAGIGGPLQWQTYVVIGLLASGGSGAWNHVLDILAAVKAKQTAPPPAVATPPAPPATKAAAA